MKKHAFILILLMAMDFSAVQAEEMCLNLFTNISNEFDIGHSWDTWMVYNSDTQEYHSYSQWAKTEELATEGFDLHNHARIRHRSSKDGVRWQDHGIVRVFESPLSNVDLAFWSGSTIYQNGKYFLFFTRAKNQGTQSEQQIQMATSKDGHLFTFHQVLLRPHDMLSQSGVMANYTYAESGNKEQPIIPALRDPHVVAIDSNDFPYKWLMLFATNLKTENGEVAHGIGRMVSNDLLNWKLIPAMSLELNDPELQVELPNISKIQDESGKENYLLMISGRKAGQVHLQFWLSPSPNGPWQAIESESHVNLATQYGFNFVRSSEGQLNLIAFDEGRIRVNSHLYNVRIQNNKVQITQ